MIRQPDEKTEAAIDDFRFLFYSLILTRGLSPREPDLKCYEESTLTEEYSTEFIFNRNYKSHKGVVFHVNNLSINPVSLIGKLWTNLHSISNLWLHMLYFFHFTLQRYE